VIGWMLDQVVDWVLGSVRDTLDTVWGLLASTLFHLPDVTGLPQVNTLASRSLGVVNVAYVLAIIAAGVAVMAQSSLQSRQGAGELLPRLVIGLVAANFATPLCRRIIDAANALVMALTGQGIASTGTFARLLELIQQQMNDPVAALLVAVIGVILVILVVMLVGGWITRWIVLIVLCGVAPLALACHGTPWTDTIARLWWRSMGGLCAIVILQAVALNTSLSLLLSPGTDLTQFGFPQAAVGGLLSLFIVVVLLWMTVRIPALVGRYLAQPGGRPHILGALVRLVIVQQITRGLSRAVYNTVANRAGRSVSGAHRDPLRARHARPRTTPSGRRLLYAFPPSPPPPPLPLEAPGPRQRDGESARDVAKRRRAAWLDASSARAQRRQSGVPEIEKWWRASWLRTARTRSAPTPTGPGPRPRSTAGNRAPTPPAAPRPQRHRSPQPRGNEGVTPRTVFVDRTAAPQNPVRRTPPRHRRNP
jgi:hypothetical protein